MSDDYLIRVRGMRHRLGSQARTTQQELKNGFIVVKATLDGREECSLIVDTGATYVAIPAALVRALGLSDQVGEPVELVLAGGIQATARKVLLPRMSVDGREARNVQAIVLDEPGMGIDGLLGQSFLNRFTYRLDKDRDSALILESDRTDTGRQETSRYRYHLSGVRCFAEAEDPLARLDLFHALGVRMSQLTYIQDNQVCCSWLQENDKGLKPLGREVVRRMKRKTDGFVSVDPTNPRGLS